MAHPTRGHRSAAYEILELVDVDLDALTLTIRHAAAYQPQTIALAADNTTAARQMLIAMAASITVSPTADRYSGWESAKTVLNGSWMAGVMLEELAHHGVHDFRSARLDIPILRSLYERMQENSKRSAVHLLARVVRAEHPNGTALARALKNTRFPVEETNPFTYDDETAEAIETAAKGVWAAHYAGTRELFERMGFDVRDDRGRGWLQIPAEDVIARYARSFPTWCQPDTAQPRDGVFDHEVAWALTHPEAFGVARGRSPLLVRPSLRQIGRLLYPDRAILTAALILHCLGENSGYNYSVLLEKSADSLIHIGQTTALEVGVKARNRSQDTRPTSTGSIFTPGGVVQTLTGLTRFTRRSRRMLADGGAPTPIVDRLYAEHYANPADTKTLTNTQLHNGWRNTVFTDHWPLSTDHTAIPLRFRALRLVAQRRAMKEGLRADVHGHGERTKVHYLAHVLPDHVFNQHAVEAQEAFHDTNVATFAVVRPDDPNHAAAALAAVPQVQVADLEVGVCTSGGNDPDHPDRRCSLGITACFTCPNGYRTVEHIPGLLAAVEFTHIIEDTNTEEWENGEAPALRLYAQAALDAFSPLVVSNVRRNVDLAPHLHTVTGMYLELRHG